MDSPRGKAALTVNDLPIKSIDYQSYANLGYW
jgi:hypothetical protein